MFSRFISNIFRQKSDTLRLCFLRSEKNWKNEKLIGRKIQRWIFFIDVLGKKYKKIKKKIHNFKFIYPSLSFFLLISSKWSFFFFFSTRQNYFLFFVLHLLFYPTKHTLLFLLNQTHPKNKMPISMFTCWTHPYLAFESE